MGSFTKFIFTSKLFDSICITDTRKSFLFFNPLLIGILLKKKKSQQWEHFQYLHEHSADVKEGKVLAVGSGAAHDPAVC